MTHRALSNDDPRLPKVLHNVRCLAMRIARRLPRDFQLDDLISAGNLGVATAIARYPGVGSGCFEAFALTHARGAMFDALRQADPMSRGSRRRARNARAAIHKLEQTLGRQPDDAEVADEIGVGVAAYREVKRQAAQVTVAADTCTGHTGHTEKQDEALIDRSRSVEELLDQRRVRAFLSDQIAQLPPRDATVVEMSYQHEQPLAVIAEKLGVSEARVCQLRKAVLKRLRAACVANDLTAPNEVA